MSETSKEVQDGTQRNVELLDKYGTGKVLLAFFLAVFIVLMTAMGGAMMVVRNDFLTQDRERTQSHERSIEKICNTHSQTVDKVERSVDKLCTTFEKGVTQDDISRAKLWEAFRKLADNAQEGNKYLREISEAKKVEGKSKE